MRHPTTTSYASEDILTVVKLDTDELAPVDGDYIIIKTHTYPPILPNKSRLHLPKPLHNELQTIMFSRTDQFPVILTNQTLTISDTTKDGEFYRALNWLMPQHLRRPAKHTFNINEIQQIKIEDDDSLIIKTSDDRTTTTPPICRAQAIFHNISRSLNAPNIRWFFNDNCRACIHFDPEITECNHPDGIVITGCCPPQPDVEWCHSFRTTEVNPLYSITQQESKQ